MSLEKLSGVELGAEVKSGRITPTEVIDFFAERIEARNPGINAFVYTKIEDAKAEAKKLEERLARGEETGPLTGVPIGLKDFLQTKKETTNTHGGVKTLIMEDPADSVFYDAAVRAGAIAEI